MDMFISPCYAAAWSVRNVMAKRIYQAIVQIVRRHENILRAPLNYIDTFRIRHWIVVGSVGIAIPITIPWHGIVSSVTLSAIWRPSTRRRSVRDVMRRQQQQQQQQKQQQQVPVLPHPLSLRYPLPLPLCSWNWVERRSSNGNWRGSESGSGSGREIVSCCMIHHRHHSWSNSSNNNRIIPSVGSHDVASPTCDAPKAWAPPPHPRAQWHPRHAAVMSAMWTTSARTSSICHTVSNF